MISPHELPTHRVTITDAHRPGYPVLSLDGEEIRTCSRAVLTLDADLLPVLEMSLFVLKDIDTDLPARVLLDDPTCKALQAMGWTPPEGEHG